MYTYNEQLLKIVSEYRNTGNQWPASTREIASWAINTGRWQPQHSEVVGQCATHLARAMREEYITDPQGRTIRAKHAARLERDGVQATLWADIRTDSREHLEIAFKQRRNQIVGDCRQLKADVDSFNDNRSPVDPIQLSLDFTADVEEFELAAA